MVQNENDFGKAFSKVAEKVKTSRRAAFREAKRDAKIPVSQQPEKVLREDMKTAESFGQHKIKDKNGNIINTREYYYKNKNGEKVVIQDHGAGHELGNQGPHFNTRPINDTRNKTFDGTKKHYPFDKK